VRTRTVTCAEQPDLWARSDAEVGVVWPEYNLHGDVLNVYWGRLEEEFADFQFVLVDDEAGAVLAQGHSIPCAWDGTVAGLPAGIDGLVEDAFRLPAAGGAPNTLSALAIEIPPAHQRQGLGERMLDGMRDLAARHGLDDLIAPLRPTWKERYPLAPIERFAAWTRDDGLPFDPWVRLHVRLGGEILAPEARSLRITGTVAEWEAWTGLPLPESGSYVFPHGLAPLEVDRERDRAEYWEPNVWVRHRIP
jgi:GNAT superfamily N-acetyltransferase